MHRLLLILLGVSVVVGASLTGCTGKGKQTTDAKDSDLDAADTKTASRDAKHPSEMGSVEDDTGFAAKLAKARAVMALERERITAARDAQIWSDQLVAEIRDEDATLSDDSIQAMGAAPMEDGVDALTSTVIGESTSPSMEIPTPTDLAPMLDESFGEMGPALAMQPTEEELQSATPLENLDPFSKQVEEAAALGAQEQSGSNEPVIIQETVAVQSDTSAPQADEEEAVLALVENETTPVEQMVSEERIDLDALLAQTELPEIDDEAIDDQVVSMEAPADVPALSLDQLMEMPGMPSLEHAKLPTSEMPIAEDGQDDPEIESLLAALDLGDDDDDAETAADDVANADNTESATTEAFADKKNTKEEVVELPRTFYVDENGEKVYIDLESKPHPLLPGQTQKSYVLNGVTYVVEEETDEQGADIAVGRRFVMVGGKKLYLQGETTLEARKYYMKDGEKVYLPAPKKAQKETVADDEATATADTPATPKSNTPMTEQEKKVAQLVEMDSIESQAQRLEARNRFYAGVNFFENNLYDEAQQAFEEALLLDPEQPDARQYLLKTRHLLNRPASGDDAALLDVVVENEHHILEYREVTMQRELGIATNLYLKAVQPEPQNLLLDRDEQIVRALGDLKKAKVAVDKVDTLLRSASLPADTAKSYRLQARGLAAQIATLEERLIQEQSSMEREKARKALEDAQQTTRERGQRTMDELFSAVRYHYEKEEFVVALDLLEKIKQMNPTNPEIGTLRQEIREAAHSKVGAELEKDVQDSTRNWALDIKQAHILPRDLLIYPDNWDEIRAREKATKKVASTDEVRSRILGKLERTRIPIIEFPQQPLSIVFDEIRQRADVNIVISSEVPLDAEIDQTFPNMNMKQILDWVCEIQGLSYQVQNEAIYITPSGTGPEQFTLELYPVADLTRPMRDYYAPRLLGQDEVDDDGFEVDEIDLPELIRTVVPGAWDSDRASMEMWEDNLLVMQTAQVHAQISHYLRVLREASKQQVLVEGRFLSVRDNFFESIGMTWLGNFWEAVPSGKQLFAGLGISPGIAQPTQLVPTLGVTNPTPYGDPSAYHYGLNVGTTLGGHPSGNGRAGPPGTYNWGSVFQALQLDAVLDAAQTTTQGSVLHNPKLIVANGKNAYVLVRSVTNYISNYTIQGDYLQPEIEQYSQGVVWDVRPVVSFDRKYITVRCRPRVESLDRDNSYFLTPQIATGEGAMYVWTGLRIEVNVTEVLDFESNATVPDGGTILIGGEIRDLKTEEVSGVPVLSSLPVLGRLFRTEQISKQGRNRVIMVSARIVELED